MPQATRILNSFGDSHALYAWSQLQVPGWEIHTHHVGARLMHTYARTEKVDGKYRAMVPGDATVFSFGEIDCRVFAANLGLMRLAEDYCAKIALLGPPYPIIMGIVPPQKEPELKYEGTPGERLGFVLQLNNDLEEKAQHRGWPFLDVYTPYAGDDGFFNPALLGKRGHIGAPGPLLAGITKILEQIR